MFTILNFIFIAVAVGNLYAVLGNPAMGIRAVSHQLAGTDGGTEQLRTALIISALAQIYLTSLVFPLKALRPEYGMAWAALMTIAACESIYTGSKMWETVSKRDATTTFPFHDSWFYKGWQVFYNLCTIAACGLLLLPQG